MTGGSSLPPNPWKRIDVSEWAVGDVEASGTHGGVWLHEPTTGARWFHKNTLIPENGIEQGEDWAEFVVAQVGQRLGVPCAEVRMCYRNGRRGSLSRSIVPEAGTHGLIDGLVALVDSKADGYFPHQEGKPGKDPKRPGVNRPGHTLSNIEAALTPTLPPPGFVGPATCTAFDVFTGYLILDALVANRDRHEENWGVLRGQLRSIRDRLAPSFDHASSLGYNRTDSHRGAMLEKRDGLTRFAEKGTAWRFENSGSPEDLVTFALGAYARCTPTAQVWWLRRLEWLSLQPLVNRISREDTQMSDLAVRFVAALLETNLGRLKDAVRAHRLATSRS